MKDRRLRDVVKSRYALPEEELTSAEAFRERFLSEGFVTGAGRWITSDDIISAVAAHKNVLLNYIYLVLNILNPEEYFNTNVPHAAAAHI
jgi:hypothetical protein